MKLVSKMKPKEGIPGQAFHYNNSNYLLCREIIKRVSDTSYSDFLKEEIFDPLEMPSTYVVNKIIAEEEINVDNFYQPGGEIYASAKDLYKFSVAYNNHEIINSTNRSTAFSRPSLLDGTRSNYGFGWYIQEDGDHKSVGHWGGGESVKSFLELYLSENRSLCILSVDCTLYVDKIHSMIRNIWNGIPYEIPKKFTRHSLDASVLQSYPGSYLLPQMGLIHVSSDDGRLYLRPDPVPGKEELVPMSDSTFTFANQDLRWQFYWKDGEIIGLGLQGKPESMGPKQKN